MMSYTPSTTPAPHLCTAFDSAFDDILEKYVHSLPIASPLLFPAATEASSALSQPPAEPDRTTSYFCSGNDTWNRRDKNDARSHRHSSCTNRYKLHIESDVDHSILLLGLIACCAVKMYI